VLNRWQLDGAFTGHKRYGEHASDDARRVGSHLTLSRADIKGRAFVATSFDEFVYVDSDSIPLQRIDTYFNSRELRDQGAAFWPDLYKDDGERQAYVSDGPLADSAGVSCQRRLAVLGIPV
jgi:hypothetical protein